MRFFDAIHKEIKLFVNTVVGPLRYRGDVYVSRATGNLLLAIDGDTESNFSGYGLSSRGEFLDYLDFVLQQQQQNGARTDFRAPRNTRDLLEVYPLEQFRQSRK